MNYIIIMIFSVDSLYLASDRDDLLIQDMKQVCEIIEQVRYYQKCISFQIREELTHLPLPSR